eukprot:1160412-Pelagomonas_calceolata.AAC.11
MRKRAHNFPGHALVFMCAGTWRPLDETLSPCDPLEFADMKVGLGMACKFKPGRKTERPGGCRPVTLKSLTGQVLT